MFAWLMFLFPPRVELPDWQPMWSVPYRSRGLRRKRLLYRRHAA